MQFILGKLARSWDFAFYHKLGHFALLAPRKSEHTNTRVRMEETATTSSAELAFPARSRRVPVVEGTSGGQERSSLPPASGERRRVPAVALPVRTSHRRVPGVCQEQPSPSSRAESVAQRLRRSPGADRPSRPRRDQRVLAVVQRCESSDKLRGSHRPRAVEGRL